MKRFLLGAFIVSNLGFSEQAAAQELSYGIKGGYSLANVRAPRRVDITNVSRIQTFNFSFYTDFSFTDGFSLQAGLAVNGKGSTIMVGYSDQSTYTEYKSNPIYLELPVNAIAKIPIGDIFDKTNIILGGGPYVAYGVSGKNQTNGKFLNKSFSDENNIYFSNDDKPVNSRNYYGEIKKFDFGFNALAGIEYHFATLNFNYSYGAVNINPGANLTPTDRFKNRVWSVSIGVKF